jgi:hypothetical protein
MLSSNTGGICAAREISQPLVAINATALVMVMALKNEAK